MEEKNSERVFKKNSTFLQKYLKFIITNIILVTFLFILWFHTGFFFKLQSLLEIFRIFNLSHWFTDLNNYFLRPFSISLLIKTLITLFIVYFDIQMLILIKYELKLSEFFSSLFLEKSDSDIESEIMLHNIRFTFTLIFGLQCFLDILIIASYLAVEYCNYGNYLNAYCGYLYVVLNCIAFIIEIFLATYISRNFIPNKIIEIAEETNDIHLIYDILKKYPTLYRKIKSEHKNSRKIVKLLMELNHIKLVKNALGLSLGEFYNDEEIQELAIRANIENLQYSCFKDDYHKVENYILKDPTAILYSSRRLQGDIDLVTMAVEKNIQLVSEINIDNLRFNKDFISLVFEKYNWNDCSYDHCENLIEKIILYIKFHQEEFKSIELDKYLNNNRNFKGTIAYIYFERFLKTY